MHVSLRMPKVVFRVFKSMEGETSGETSLFSFILFNKSEQFLSCLKENGNKKFIASFKGDSKTICWSLLQNFYIILLYFVRYFHQKYQVWYFSTCTIYHKWGHAILFSHETMIKMCPYITEHLVSVQILTQTEKISNNISWVVDI